MGLLGQAGVGKTSTIKEYCEILAPEGYLFVECGKESGVDALQDIIYINCPKWHDDYDELNNSVGFAELIEDIVENKDEEYPELRVVVIDTYDQLQEIAEKEVVRLHNKEHSDKKVKSVRGAFGGFAAGTDMADEMIIDSLFELKHVGVNFIVLGHIRNRDITDPVSEETFTQITTDMSSRSFNKIKNKLDVLGVAYIDREIINKQKKKKMNGKEIEVGKIAGQTRKIAFRDDDYAIDSKSRFADIANEIPLDGQALVDAMTNAIKAEIEGKGGKIADEKKSQKKTNEAKSKRASEYSKKKKESAVDEDRNEELKTKIQSGFGDMEDDVADTFKAKMEEFGITSFKDVSEIPTKHLEELVSIMDGERE